MIAPLYGYSNRLPQRSFLCKVEAVPLAFMTYVSIRISGKEFPSSRARGVIVSASSIFYVLGINRRQDRTDTFLVLTTT